MNSKFSENPDKTIALENFSVNQQFTGNHAFAIAPKCNVCIFCSSSCLLYVSGCLILDAIDIDLHISLKGKGKGKGKGERGKGKGERVRKKKYFPHSPTPPLLHSPTLPHSPTPPLLHSPTPPHPHSSTPKSASANKALQYMKEIAFSTRLPLN